MEPRLSETVFSVGHCAALACALEVAAPKVGNVHRAADFADLSYYDFLLSAQIVGQVFDDGLNRGIGELVLDIVSRTREAVRSNTNLGIALLLPPLALVARSGKEFSASTVAEVLQQSTADDCHAIFEAIRLAAPGGLGSSSKWDVHGPAPDHILIAMKAAADRDLVGRQYATAYSDVFEIVVPELIDQTAATGSLIMAIVIAHVRLLATHSDSLIERKCGRETAKHAQVLAQKAMDMLPGGVDQFMQSLKALDFWLRADGNRRNPGATADLIAAGLFVGLWERRLSWLVP